MSLDDSDKTEIKEVTGAEELVFIVRNDSSGIAKFFQRVILDFHGIDKSEDVIRKYYDMFTVEVMGILYDYFEKNNGSVRKDEFHIDEIHARLRKRLAGKSVINLDKYFEFHAPLFQHSRLFAQDAQTPLGYSHISGLSSVEEQIDGIRKHQSSSVALVDDDFTTGGTFSEVTRLMAMHQISVHEICPGIKRGAGKAWDPSITISPVYEYRINDERDILEATYLKNPRDFLFGVAGSVVKLPTGIICRGIPYIAPFTEAWKRLRLKQEEEDRICIGILNANYKFFEAIQKGLGIKLSVTEMGHNFGSYLKETFNLSSTTLIIDLIRLVLENYSALKKRMEGIRKSLEPSKTTIRLV